VTIRAIACSFHTASGSGGYGGKTYYWDFSEMFGPLFTDAEGNEIEPQPGVRSHAFKAFSLWLEEMQREKHLMMAAHREGLL
jgi:hypothetical protein